MEDDRIILGVGLDESNHGWDIRKKGEIVVATFSLYSEDLIVRKFPNRRDFKKLHKWLKKPYVDYRYTMLLRKESKETYSNLVRIAPYLIKSYIEENLSKVDKLKIYLDGRLEKGGRNILRENFLGYKGIEQVVVDNFIKKNKNKKGNVCKRPYCPSVVYYADVCAADLLTEQFHTLIRNEKFVVCE